MNLNTIILALVGARPMNICERNLNIDDLKLVSEEQKFPRAMQCNSEAEQKIV
jgi:hypothetical protein